jgi:hypothetical protein
MPEAKTGSSITVIRQRNALSGSEIIKVATTGFDEYFINSCNFIDIPNRSRSRPSLCLVAFFF